MLPDYATHYYLPVRRPFMNLSDVPTDELATILDSLKRSDKSLGSQRTFGPRYMELRAKTEEKMRRLFIEAGGKPERNSPHYFVLGSSAWFSGLASEMAEVHISLSELPSQLASFTYPDSFTAMGLIAEYGLPYEPRPYHNHVYLLDQLPDIVKTYGLPADESEQSYKDYHKRTFEKYIEIQVWSDKPINYLIEH